MEYFKPFTSSDLKTYLSKRSKESKFGEQVALLSDFSNIYEQLSKLDVRYVVFGIKEDIGVFANYGHTGTSQAWDAVIKSLINIQSNGFTKAKKVLILGELNFIEYQKKLEKLEQSSKKDILKARKMVAKIDTEVSFLVSQIVQAGKIPIIIGGGHNNAYGNIKGSALALKQPISAINFDAHHDFRAEEGRHSGNGFSYAFAEGFLKRYFIFGLHENYISDRIVKTLKKIKFIKYNTFESIAIRKELKFKNEMVRAAEHIGEHPFGLEIDCDAIQGVSSSAMTPSGFSTNNARRFVDYFGQNKNVVYLHICEASPDSENASQIGKLISFLITDFIRANNHA